MARLPGKRGYLGTTDLLRTERLALKAWGLAEEANGHCLSRQDLFRQWKLLVTRRADLLRTRQTDEGELSDHSQKVRKFAQDRLTCWQKT